MASKIFANRFSTSLFGVPEIRKKKINPLSATLSGRHKETILFSDKGLPIGFFYGHIENEITFRMQTTGLLKPYRNKGIYSRFLNKLSLYIETLGYERITSYHHPNNTAVLIPKLKSGFMITSMELSEKWGAMIALTYFIHDDRKNSFLKSFGMSSWD